MNPKLLGATTLFAAFAILTATQSSHAGTVAVDLATFNAETVGQTTTNFDGYTVQDPSGYDGFTNPASITVNGITFTASSPFLNINDPSIYGTTGNVITNSYPPGGDFDTLTITLGSNVTAFGVDFASSVNLVSFALNNGFTQTVGASTDYSAPGFVGFVSTQPFNVITLSIASPEGWEVADVVTASATPLPAALPLFASGLGGLGLLGWRRKRKAAAVAAA